MKLIMTVNVQYEQQRRQEIQCQNAERQQDDYNSQDEQKNNMQNLYQALTAQQDGVSQRWQKAMQDLRKAKQAQFNERMQWEHLDSRHMDQLVDGTTDWLSDAFRQKFAEQRRARWDSKQHIDADSRPYKIGFYLGMAFGNSQARKQMLKKVHSRTKMIGLNAKVAQAQAKVDTIKKEDLPGIDVDADYAVQSAPDEQKAREYANASHQERLNGHTPLTPETAAMESLMADQSAFDAMKKPGADIKTIRDNLASFKTAINDKAERDHVPQDLISKERTKQLVGMLADDPRSRYLYAETMDGLDLKDGELVSKGVAGHKIDVDNLTPRKPLKLSEYMAMSFKDFRTTCRDMHLDKNQDHSQMIQDYRSRMLQNADLASFDNDVSIKSVIDAMKAGTLTTSMDASMHYYQKKFGKDKGAEMAQQSFAFAQHTLAYKASDVEGAAKQFAKDNKIKGISQKDQVNALMYAHSYTQDAATLTGLDPNTVNEFYNLEAKDLFKGSERKFNTDSLKYFNGDNLQKAVPSFDQNVLYQSGNFVDHPLDSPGVVLEKALNETKQAGADTRDLQRAYDEFNSLGTTHNIKKHVKDSKAKNKARKQEIVQNNEDSMSKSKKHKALGKKTKKVDPARSEKQKPEIDNDPVFGDVPNVDGDDKAEGKPERSKKYGPVLEQAKKEKAEAEGKTIGHKEVLPSLEEMNPTLASNIKKAQNPEKDDDELVFHH